MSARESGKKIVLVGLAVQLVFFACYMATTIYVWIKPEYTVYQGPRDKSLKSAKRKVMASVVITTVILYLRSIYRIAEFADGYGGKIYSAEWAFYVFDTILIFLAFVVYIVLFFGPNFPRNAVDSPDDTNTLYSAPGAIENGQAQLSSVHLVEKRN
ncbi:hypothetical protein GGI07_002962 [Coemansia sp. Benny D115]|nr:hypothetical protein GGI07_002962 [Coemansia sp. Benny D115]